MFSNFLVVRHLGEMFYSYATDIQQRGKSSYLTPIQVESNSMFCLNIQWYIDWKTILSKIKKKKNAS